MDEADKIRLTKALLGKTFKMADIDADVLKKLSDSASIRLLKKGRVLLNQGTKLNEIYFVISGIFMVMSYNDAGFAFCFNIVGPKWVLGMPVILGERPTISETIALEDAKVLVIPNEQIVPVLQGCPTVLMRIINMLQANLRDTCSQLVDTIYLSPDRRLAKFLAAIFTRLGRKELPLSNQDLAMMLGITPQTASRLIDRLQRLGAIRKLRGKIVLVSAIKLEAAAAIEVNPR